MLSYNELIELVEQNVITDVKPDAVNGTSIDVHLGSELITESYGDYRIHIVDIKQRTNFKSANINIAGHYYDLNPGEFVLAHTVEKFNLPSDISAEFKLKSSGARSGIDNALATWCDPGWHGSSLTLELKNNLRYHNIRITEGMPIGQMVFHRVKPVPENRDYSVRGRYNRDTSVSAVKL